MTQLHTVDAKTIGLVLVDVQSAFVSAGSPLADEGLDTARMAARLPAVRSLLSVSREASIPIAFTRSVRRADGRDAPSRTYDIVPAVYRDGDPFCVAGSPAVEYAPGVEPGDEAYEVEKIRYDPFAGTRLESYLRYEAVDTVLVAGFTTNICVEAAARSAYERGFNVALVEDCCESFTESQHESAVRNVELAYGEVTSLETVTAVLRSE